MPHSQQFTINKEQTAMALILFKEHVNNPKWWTKHTRRSDTGETFVTSEFTSAFASYFETNVNLLDPYMMDAALALIEPARLKNDTQQGEAK